MPRAPGDIQHDVQAARRPGTATAELPPAPVSGVVEQRTCRGYDVEVDCVRERRPRRPAGWQGAAMLEDLRLVSSATPTRLLLRPRDAFSGRAPAGARPTPRCCCCIRESSAACPPRGSKRQPSTRRTRRAGRRRHAAPNICLLAGGAETSSSSRDYATAV